MRERQRNFDIDKKRADEALDQSKECPNLKFVNNLSPSGVTENPELINLIDVQTIRPLMDDFYKLAHTPIGINDLKGNVLVNVGWQDICTKFHRVHPEACKYCIESDAELSSCVLAGEFKLYRCKNNMWDIVTPIIVSGQHVGYVFSGQFFFKDEPLDYELFRSQAKQYGFNEEEYIAALERVPRLSKESVDTAMSFLTTFTNMVSQLGYRNLKLAQSLEERDSLVNKLQESEKALEKAYNVMEEKVKERTAELERAYNSLKESEKRLAEAQRMAHIGSYDWNIQTDEEYWSAEIYRIFGLDPKLKLNHDMFLNCIHLEDLDYVNHAINGALKGKPYHIDYRIILPDGKERVVYSQGGVIFDEENTPIRMRGIIQDITESKIAQQKLQQSEEKYRFFVQSFKGITFQLDKDLNIEFFHGAIKEITGYGEEELSSDELWTQLVVPEDLGIFLEAEAKAVQSPGDYLGEVYYRIKTRDGSIKWVHEVHQKTQNEKGEPLYTGVVFDITEKKEAEEALKNLEIIRRQEIHHRIKNNLQVISSLLDLQAEKFNNREYVKDSEIVEAFKESQDRVTSIALIHEELHEEEGINDTLNFSLYLQRLAENLFQTYKFRSTEICLDLDLEENIFFSMDIAVPLGMVVNELISNSFKYAFPYRKTGEIGIKLFSEETVDQLSSKKEPIKKDAKYTLIVSDNGVGISEEIDFENTDSLGLQLVNLLVDQLDGTIELKRDHGTEFTIRFNNVES